MKISIIIPIYNSGAYLRRCLDSVVSQTYTHLEIILIDDGSTDESGAICDEYAAKDARVKLIRKEHAGQSAVRNAALQAAAGDYIGYVDSDDSIEPQMYESMLAALTEHQAQIAVCRYRQVGAGEEKAAAPAPTGAVYAFSRTEALDIFIREDMKYRIMSSVWSKLFAREVIYGLEFDHIKCMSDFMYTTKALCQADKVVYLDQYLYNYNIGRNDSLTNQKTAENRFNNEVPVFRGQFEYLRGRGLLELADKAAYYFYRRMLFYYIDSRRGKNRKLARRIVKMMRGDRREINALYRNPWAKAGDRARMRVFLFWPGFYYFLVKQYERYIIPVRVRD